MSEVKVPERSPRLTGQQLDTRLARASRLGLALLGLAGLGSGAVAVFITQLEAGPVALLAVGLILLLIGASGRLPNRLKFGDNEAAWDAVEHFTTRIVEDTPAESRPEVLDALTELAGAAPRAAAPALSALAYLQSVYSMLSTIVNDLNEISRKAGGGVYSIAAPGASDEPIADLTIMMPSGSLLGINISSAPGATSPAAITRANYNLRTDKAAGYLFISRGHRDPISIDRLIAGLPGPTVRITVEGPEDRLGLADALARLMSAADNHAR